MMPTKSDSFKLGVAFGLFNCMYKTLYLKYKIWIFSNPNEFVSTNDQFENILENAHISFKVNDIGHNFHV